MRPARGWAPGQEFGHGAWPRHSAADIELVEVDGVNVRGGMSTASMAITGEGFITVRMGNAMLGIDCENYTEGYSAIASLRHIWADRDGW